MNFQTSHKFAKQLFWENQAFLKQQIRMSLTKKLKETDTHKPNLHEKLLPNKHCNS